MIARQFRVHGQVQGVSFRAFTVKQAIERDLAGWVRNVTDGTVEGCVLGPADAVEAFLDALLQGPPLAEVEGLYATEFEPRTLPRPFSVQATTGEHL